MIEVSLCLISQVSAIQRQEHGMGASGIPNLGLTEYSSARNTM